MVLLTIFSVIPQAGVDFGKRGDKAAHFISYFITALLFYYCYRNRFRKADILSVLFAFCYGAFLEVVQCIVPRRVGSIGDLVANTSGVLFFYILYKLLWERVE